ncbi:MAG TPA: hypothetical protein VFJ91_03160 [Gaiellaceae bacterium]|nr:hypothetical protein [Gaiellaceae bacterium]
MTRTRAFGAALVAAVLLVPAPAALARATPRTACAIAGASVDASGELVARGACTTLERGRRRKLGGAVWSFGGVRAFDSAGAACTVAATSGSGDRFAVPAAAARVQATFRLSLAAAHATRTVVVTLHGTGSCSSPQPTAAAPDQLTPGKRFASTAAAWQLAAATTLAEAESALQAFLSQYGLAAEVAHVDESSYAQTWDRFDLLAESDLPALREYGELFVDEWSKYPLDWVRASGVRAIAFVKDFTTGADHRAAGPDPVGETMYYDVPFSGTGDYAREVIHHEFDHLLTYDLFGSYAPADPAWTALNPAGFAYGSGGASCYAAGDPCGAWDQHPQSGFVSGYARSAIEEDKAELYAYLMTATGWHQVEQWLATDPALAGKVALLQALLARYSPEMAGDYFDRIDP